MEYCIAPAGAVLRPTQAKLSERISVKDFGAMGDGCTDDAPAFRRAVAYVANLTSGTATGGRLYVPQGEYAICGAPIVLPEGKPIELFGEGAGSKLFRKTGTGAIIEVRSGSVISGLFFRGPESGASNGILCSGANVARIENCTFQNQVTGIQLASSYAVELVSNVFEACYTYGVIATTSAHNTMIERCNFFTCGVLNNGHAVNFTVPSDNIGIKDSDFEYCNVNVALNGCSSVQITGNYMEYHKAECFVFAPGCQGVIIESNWIALGLVGSGGDTAVVENIVGGRFIHNTIHDQSVSFNAGALVGFEVGLNKKTGTGTLSTTPWIAPLLTNGWAQQPFHTAVGFIKDARGWVHLRGGLTTGVAPAPCFVLPAAYRPSNIAVFSTQSASGGCRITVKPTGEVEPTVAASNNTCLDGISFYVG